MYEPGSILVAWACPLCGYVEMQAGEPVIDATPVVSMFPVRAEEDRQAETSFARMGH
jgi:hypothetical protein